MQNIHANVSNVSFNNKTLSLSVASPSRLNNFLLLGSQAVVSGDQILDNLYTLMSSKEFF